MLYQRESGAVVDQEMTQTSPRQHWPCYILKDIRIPVNIYSLIALEGNRVSDTPTTQISLP